MGRIKLVKMLEVLKNWDTELFLLLNGKHNPFFDSVMSWISDKESWYPLYALIIIYIIYKNKWRSILTIVFIALVVTASDQISVHLFKNVFERLRPCHNPYLTDLVHLVNDHCGGKFGFVSSHAANSFSIAVFLSYLFKNKYFTSISISWALVVSYSRVYLGVHFLGDILGGMVLGILLGWGFFYMYKFALNKWFS